MSEQFDELRLAGCLTALHDAVVRGTVIWEGPGVDEEEALEAAKASLIKILPEGSNVSIFSGDDRLWTGTKTEYEEALRRFGAFAKELDKRRAAPDN
jgi:hypothetical protein